METRKINEITNTVCEMLFKKRVGFLWYGAANPLPEASGFSWVHYYWHTSTSANTARCYNLSNLRAPMSEGRTLDMLVIPSGTLGILLEIASEITVSPASRLTEGVLREGKPVLFDASAIRERLESSDDGKLEKLRKIAHCLKNRGMEFIGLEDEARACRENIETDGEHTPPRTVVLSGGWLSWNEISPLIAGAEAVRLAAGAKLTPEARDRLLKLKIRVEERGRLDGIIS
jgi:hypothetical protein